jgi:hypothetical protein
MAHSRLQKRSKKQSPTPKLPVAVKSAPETPLNQTPFTPASVLQLQRLAGNQAVQRLIAQRQPAKPDITPMPQRNAPPVQRLAWNETPVQPGFLMGVTRLTGGKVGSLFNLTNMSKENLVVKFQEEDPARTIIGTEIMKKAGVKAPSLRVASDNDKNAIEKSVKGMQKGYSRMKKMDSESETLPNSPKLTMLGSSPEPEQTKKKKPASPEQTLTQYLDDAAKFSHMLLMEFVMGEKAGTPSLSGHQPTDDFEKALHTPAFQVQLGRMLAADAFAGNSDRLHGILTRSMTSEGMDESAWFNGGNILLQSDQGKFIQWAVDNDFSPGKKKAYPISKGAMQASLAAAIPVEFAKEAGMIYDSLMGKKSKPEKLIKLGLFSSKKTKQKRKEQLKQLKQWKEWNTNRQLFINNLSKGAFLAMRGLLKRGQSWKQLIRDKGGSEDMVNDFRIRKRLLHLIKGGVEARRAHGMATKPDLYRKWVLETEFKLSKEVAADAVYLGKTVYSYIKLNAIDEIPDTKTGFRRWLLKRLKFGIMDIGFLMDDDGAYKASVTETIKSGTPSLLNSG